jgi:hypothetical protein
MKGEDGADGKDAYEVWLEDNPLNGSVEPPSDYVFDLEKDGDRLFYSKEEFTSNNHSVAMVIPLDENGNDLDDKFKFIFWGRNTSTFYYIYFIIKNGTYGSNSAVSLASVDMGQNLTQDIGISVNMMINALKQKDTWEYPTAAKKFRVSSSNDETFYGVNQSIFTTGTGATSIFDNSKEAYYEAMKGEDGVPGERGIDGKSAYEVWKEDNPLYKEKLEENTLITSESFEENLYSLSETIDEEVVVFHFVNPNYPNALGYTRMLVKYNGTNFKVKNQGSAIELMVGDGTSFTIKQITDALIDGGYTGFFTNGSEYAAKIIYNTTFDDVEVNCKGISIKRDSTEEDYYKAIKGDDYTITEQDYDAIANVVLSKMTNAEEVDY